MTSFAPVCPIGIAEKLEHYGLYGNYHLLIAHEVLKEPSRWFDLMKKIRNRNGVIIMDNGLIEAGQAIAPSELMEACQTSWATHVVLPDKVAEGEETVELSGHAIELFRRSAPEGLAYIGVAQGKTYEEVRACAGRLFARLNVDMIAIPRHLQQRFGSRFSITCDVLSLYQTPVHLLGFSDSLRDDLKCTRLGSLVQGIDSAMPFWYSFVADQAERRQMRVGDVQPFLDPEVVDATSFHRPSSYWAWEYLTISMIANLEAVRRAVNGS